MREARISSGIVHKEPVNETVLTPENCFNDITSLLQCAKTLSDDISDECKALVTNEAKSKTSDVISVRYKREIGRSRPSPTNADDTNECYPAADPSDSWSSGSRRRVFGIRERSAEADLLRPMQMTRMNVILPRTLVTAGHRDLDGGVNIINGPESEYVDIEKVTAVMKTMSSRLAKAVKTIKINSPTTNSEQAFQHFKFTFHTHLHYFLSVLQLYDDPNTEDGFSAFPPILLGFINSRIDENDEILEKYILDIVKHKQQKELVSHKAFYAVLEDLLGDEELGANARYLAKFLFRNSFSLWKHESRRGIDYVNYLEHFENEFFKSVLDWLDLYLEEQLEKHVSDASRGDFGSLRQQNFPNFKEGEFFEKRRRYHHRNAPKTKESWMMGKMYDVIRSHGDSEVLNMDIDYISRHFAEDNYDTERRLILKMFQN